MGARLQSVLGDLRDRYGATAADLTADELEMLVDACKRVDNPFSAINASLCERPVPVCKGFFLWPITAGAQIWLTEYAEQWWKEGTAMWRYAQVYALHNARNPDAFVNLTTKTAARKALMRTGLICVAHGGEIAAAIAEAYGIHPNEAEKTDAEKRREALKAKMGEASATDFASMVARLEVQSGIPARDWLWGHGLMHMVNCYRQQAMLAVAAAGGMQADADASLELDDAVQNLARALAQIGKRLTEEKKNEQGH